MFLFLDLFYRFWTRASALIYGGEGINLPLKVMPTRFISPLLRQYGANIGNRVRFLSPVVIHNSKTDSKEYYRNLSVGNDCYFGRELFLDLQDKIIVKEQVTISHRVMILTHTDAGTSPLKDTLVSTSQESVIIHRGAYIGAQATILQGVEVGEESIIAAGAMVTQSVPSHSVVAGVPAKIIKSLL